MRLRVVRFSSLVFTALLLVPALAHVLELPAKLRFSREEYFVAQQLYRGWSWFGVIVGLALASTIAFTFRAARSGHRWGAPLLATLALAGAQAVFWVFTFPANRITRNWTVPVEEWEAWRAQWEYSHAAGAALTFLALVALLRADAHPPRAIPP